MDAKSLRWYTVCSTLENLPKLRQKEQRRSALEELINKHRKFDPEFAAQRAPAPSGEHMYSLIRLLLPQRDRTDDGNNVVYNMKEGGITKIFIRAMGLQGTDSCRKLENWKKPEGGEGYGHFDVVLYHQMTPRGRVHHTGREITVANVNRFLDDMWSASNNSDEQVRLVTELMKSASAFELQWIAKVLLRELRTSATEDLVLSAYHPDARECFQFKARLREVVELCRDPKIRLGEACIEVNCPFKPMLTEKMQGFNLIPKYFKNKPFWIEPKLDGERIIIHMADGVMTCFTRSSNDYSQLYRPALEDLKPLIKASKCILDGEIIPWNRATESWVPFGNNTTVAQHEGGTLPANRAGTGSNSEKKVVKEKDFDPKDCQMCLVLFDVLRIDNERLEQKPLRERRERLHKLIDADMLKDPKYDKRVEIVVHKEATNEEHVKAELQKVLQESEEGLILKDPASLYKANVRDKGGWYKLKPEYIDGGTEEYDVVIIGGAYGKNKQSGSLRTWVCGIAVKPPPGEKPTEFLSMCRIGTGLKRWQFRELAKHMEPYKRSFDIKKYKSMAPPVKENGSTIARTQRGIRVTYPRKCIGGVDLPAVDVWYSGNPKEEAEVIFDPRESVCLTLIADYRLIESDVWMTGRGQSDTADKEGNKTRGWTLRFPRVKPQGIRLTSLDGADKSWDDIMTSDDFTKIIYGERSCGQRLASAMGGDAGTTFQARKRKRSEGVGGRGGTGSLGIAARHQAFDPSKFERISHVLNGCTICVLPAAPGEDGSKDRENIQRQVVHEITKRRAHELGAIIVSNPDHDTTHLIAMVKDQKFLNLKEQDKDIISHLWICECYERRELVPLEPQHMWHASLMRRREFEGMFDRYHDSYTRNLEPNELRQKLDDANLWDGMEDDSDGEMTQDIKVKLEDDLMAYAASEHAAPNMYMESQATLTASLAQSLVNDDGCMKEVPDVLLWSRFRGVCALFLDHVTTRHQSVLPDSDQQQREVHKDGKILRSAWISLAEARLKAGGGRVIDAHPVLHPRPHARRQSHSFKKKRIEENAALAGKGITHVVCCERLLKSDRAAVEDKLESLDLKVDELNLVTDAWINKCFHLDRLCPIEDQYLFSHWVEPRPRPAGDDAQFRTFVSAPRYEFDSSQKGSEEFHDDSTLPWMAVKIVMDEEVDETGKVHEYPGRIEITDGICFWHASISSYDEFINTCKLENEALGDSFSARVCHVLKFPWGADIGFRRQPVKDCVWRFGDAKRKKEWRGERQLKGSKGGRELCIRWKNTEEKVVMENRGGSAQHATRATPTRSSQDKEEEEGEWSHFVLWLNEESDLVQPKILDLTNLLISQAQHVCADIRDFHLRLDEAQSLKDEANKDCGFLKKREKENYTLVMRAGTNYINDAKRPVQEFMLQEMKDEEDANYKSDDDEKAYTWEGNGCSDDDDGMADGEGGSGGVVGGVTVPSEKKPESKLLSKRQRERQKREASST